MTGFEIPQFNFSGQWGWIASLRGRDLEVSSGQLRATDGGGGAEDIQEESGAASRAGGLMNNQKTLHPSWTLWGFLTYTPGSASLLFHPGSPAQAAEASG